MAGSTSFQSRREALASRPISSALTASGSPRSRRDANRPPLKRRTIASAALEAPPVFIARQRSPTRMGNFSGAGLQRSRMAVNVSGCGNRPTD